MSKNIRLWFHRVICFNTLMNLRFLTFLPFILFCAGLCKASDARAADEPLFAFPAACTLGQNCWTVNYVDVDAQKGAHSDFTCGVKTEDEHKGVDYGLRSRAEMETGVDVLAAADGKVMRLRNGESDSVKTNEEFEAIKEARKECGNAVLIDHGGGLSTLYCHLKNGSLSVAIDDEVKAGQKIAQIGQSGLSRFPHLHFGAVKGGAVLDPYTGETTSAGCGRFKRSYWKGNMPYEPITVFDAGFSAGTPDFAAIRSGAGAPESLSSGGGGLALWAGFYQLRTGDEITLKITDTNGQIFAERHITAEENRLGPVYYYTGRTSSGAGTLPAGTYNGEITYTRKGLEPRKISRNVRVE